MKQIVDVEQTSRVPKLDQKTKQRMEEIFKQQERDFFTYDSDIILMVDRFGRLVEEFHHPI